MKSFQFIVFAVVFIAGVVSSSLLELEDDDWEDWKARHGRSYSGHEEEVRRKEIWKENIAMIAKHNLDYQSGVHSYRLSMNQFGDLKPDEFLQLYTGLKRNITRKAVPDQPSSEDVTEVPSSVDWREKGYVTKVKNQGNCGSCWAFSATGALEGQNFKKTGKLVSLSEQNLVDCTLKRGNYGCQGGFMERAFQYIVHAGGIDTEESYPYEAKDGQCRFKTSEVGATCRGYTVRYFSEKSLKKAVAKVGPISVGIDATSSFMFYSHGIFSDPTCKSDLLNHGVLVVGYGSSSGEDYWIVKNSWGTSWGMEGYVLMSRNNNNQCGIATDASYPLV